MVRDSGEGSSAGCETTGSEAESAVEDTEEGTRCRGGYGKRKSCETTGMQLSRV